VVGVELIESVVNFRPFYISGESNLNWTELFLASVAGADVIIPNFKVFQLVGFKV
jgi:hypothetical protein